MKRIIPGVSGMGRPEESLGRIRGRRVGEESQRGSGRWNVGEGALGRPFLRPPEAGRAEAQVSRRMRIDLAWRHQHDSWRCVVCGRIFAFAIDRGDKWMDLQLEIAKRYPQLHVPFQPSIPTVTADKQATDPLYKP